LSRLLAQALVPETATGRRLAVIALLDALGTGMFLTSAALYFTRIVGLRATQVGLGLTVAGLVGLVTAVPLGAIADRVGAGRVFIALQALRGFGFLAYCLVSSFAPFVAVACVVGAIETVTPPLTVALVGAAVPEDVRVQTMARLRAARNVGFGLGALVATAAIVAGSRGWFVAMIVADAGTFFVTSVGMLRMGFGRLAPTAGVGRLGGESRAVPNPRYLVASLLNGILAIHMTLLTLGLPLWIATRTRAPVGVVGACVVANTVLAVALQAWFARAAARLSGAARAMLRAGVALAAFCALAAIDARIASPALAALVAVVSAVALTFGELWQSAGEWKISYDLADPAHRARYLSAFQLGSGAQQVAGPLIVTALVLPHAWGWGVLAALALGAGIAFQPLIFGAPARSPSLNAVPSAVPHAASSEGEIS
jgi:MFS family permease